MNFFPPSATPLRYPGRGLWNSDLLVFETLPSTNQWALDHAAGLAHGTAVRAIRQTAGRGRFERRWFSADDRGLALSVVLHADPLLPEHGEKVGFAAAIAVCTTLNRYGVTSALQWPNDIIVNGRKIAGLLGERTTAPDRIVLGIGLNVNLTHEDVAFILPPGRATSLRMETGRDHDPSTVCADLLAALAVELRPRSPNQPSLWEVWARHDYLRGRRLALRASHGRVTGRYAGLDEQGYLRLVTDDGVELRFASGDVSLEGLEDTQNSESPTSPSW